MIVLDVGGVRATYKAGKWSTGSDDEDLALALDGLTRTTDDPPGSDPYPMLTRVKQVAAMLGATIVDEGEPPSFNPKVVY